MKSKFLVGQRCVHWCSLAQERYRGSSPFGEMTKAVAVTGGCLQRSVRQKVHRSGVVEARKQAGEEARGSSQNGLGHGSVGARACHEGGGERPVAHWWWSVASARTATALDMWRNGELIGRVDGQRAQAEEGGGGSSMRMAACSTSQNGKGMW
jgi:hypothetical protein